MLTPTALQVSILVETNKTRGQQADLSDAPLRTAIIEANVLTFEVDRCGANERLALLLQGSPEPKNS